MVHWEPLGGALNPLTNPPAITYWAPEVAHKDGRYYLYYSASTTRSDEHHRIRVALADHPAGPFDDMGKILIPQLGFTIDASPFRDPQTGKWHLFFATDYETDEPHGTGVAVVELCDSLTSIVGDPKPVVRAGLPFVSFADPRASIVSGNPYPYGTARVQPPAIIFQPIAAPAPHGR